VSANVDLLDRHRPLGGAEETGAHYVVLDVFTEQPLSGNPLAVFTDARELPERSMQPLAREMNLSESVFVLPGEHDGEIRARIFTPAAEMPFAGHPVLGTAVLAGIALERDAVTIQTLAGAISVELTQRSARGGFGRMAQPIPTWQAFGRSEALLRALGMTRSRLPVEEYVNGPRFALVVAEDERELTALDPDLRALAGLGALGVSCVAGSGERWRTRMFAPALGVPEDPATGSAAGPIAVHLARHGEVGFGVEIEIAQGAEVGRPSRLLARAAGSAERVERVEVAGHAVVVAEGAMVL
jgi:trans-2,3-dihydro-3-hydroxyanthranilate isomerase